MTSKGKVVVAMSGGVDSSVAAGLLVEQGYEVVGFFMRTGLGETRAGAGANRHQGCCSATDAADARFVAGKLGIRFYALNFQEEFDSLVDYFADEYANGRTPNPCVVCNNRLKFGRIIDYADSIDAAWIATGHYARIGTRNHRPILQRAVDHRKDQSYVLFGLNAAVLPRLIFPLGHLTKEQVRNEARRMRLPVSEKPDSVDICFVPDRNYAAVVRQRRPEVRHAGLVLDQAGRTVGAHDGVAHYTIGQRRGLGIALGLPVYVTHLDSSANTVTVGPRQALLRRGLAADRFNWFIDPPKNPAPVFAQIRYQHRASPATVETLPSDRVRLMFEEPQVSITPGQAVVLYDDADCLGGGWIQNAFDDLL